MTLRPLRGHTEIRESLARSFARGALPAALLIRGPRGVGKQRLALWTGQLVLCEAPGPSGPCDRCRACRLALRLEHPDLHWHFPLPRPRGSFTPEKLAEALEQSRYAELSEIREQPLRSAVTGEPRGFYLAAAQTLRRKAQARPSMGNTQVFIVGDAEYLVPQESSPEAANALLKLLEEPPGGSRFLLTTSKPGRILPTIRSRTVPLHLSELSAEEVEAFLVEEAEADPPLARQAASLSQGSIGRALGFLPDGDGPGPLETLRKEAYRLLRAGLATGSGAAFTTALEYRPAGARGLLDLFTFVDAWIRDLAAVASGAPERILNADAGEDLAQAVRAARIEPQRAATALEAVEQAREQAQGNVNPQLIIAGLIMALQGCLAHHPSRPA